MTNLLMSKDLYDEARSSDLIDLKCIQCDKAFDRIKIQVKRDGGKFCSHKCSDKSRIKRQQVKCLQCSTEFSKQLKEVKKSPNHFCSQSCAATYNNAHKTKGNRRSKLEVWLEAQLPLKYPNLVFHFNRKDAINSELDIYIPSMNLAFELNGIFHYEPIFGKDKLSKIQNNDNRKFQACIEKGIELCIIDTSKQAYFKEQTAKKYLDIVTNIIDIKIGLSELSRRDSRRVN